MKTHIFINFYAKRLFPSFDFLTARSFSYTFHEVSVLPLIFFLITFAASREQSTEKGKACCLSVHVASASEVAVTHSSSSLRRRRHLFLSGTSDALAGVSRDGCSLEICCQSSYQKKSSARPLTSLS